MLTFWMIVEQVTLTKPDASCPIYFLKVHGSIEPLFHCRDIEGGASSLGRTDLRAQPNDANLIIRGYFACWATFSRFAQGHAIWGWIL